MEPSSAHTQAAPAHAAPNGAWRGSWHLIAINMALLTELYHRQPKIRARCRASRAHSKRFAQLLRGETREASGVRPSLLALQNGTRARLLKRRRTRAARTTNFARARLIKIIFNLYPINSETVDRFDLR